MLKLLILPTYFLKISTKINQLHKMYSPLVSICFYFNLQLAVSPCVWTVLLYVYLLMGSFLSLQQFLFVLFCFFACYIIYYCWPSTPSFLSLKLICNSNFPSIGRGPIIVWVGFIRNERRVFLLLKC